MKMQQWLQQALAFAERCQRSRLEYRVQAASDCEGKMLLE